MGFRMATKRSLFAVLVLLLMAALDVCAFNLTISPINMHVLPRQRVKIMCQADAPLVGCQFKRVFSNSLYDLSLGQLTSYSRDFMYYGTGLSTGQCGISLTEYVREHTYDIIACRARTVDGGWKYAQMSLVINSNATFLLSITPSRPVVLPGGNVTIMCQADQPISSCLFKWNNTSWTVLNESSSPMADYKYTGAGLDRGQCGITFMNAKPELTGNVICSAWTKARPKGYEAATAPLVVATVPTVKLQPPAIDAIPTNGTLSATCMVQQASPSPRITWLLGDEVIGEDECAKGAGTVFRWPYEGGDCEAKLTRKVDWQDNGKDLVCRVHHIALSGGKTEVKLVLNVTFAPVPPSTPILLHGFRVGRAAEVDVHVAANPSPEFIWTFANNTLAEGEALDGGRVQALRATKGSCGWQAKLIISDLEQSDLDQEVRLTATNQVGSVDIELRLDTAPASTEDSETARCAGRVKHVEPLEVVPGKAVPNTLKHEVVEPTSCPHTGLTIAILLLVALLAGAGVWYSRSRWHWCKGRKQFSRSNLGEDCEDTDDVDARRFR